MKDPRYPSKEFDTVFHKILQPQQRDGLKLTRGKPVTTLHLREVGPGKCINGEITLYTPRFPPSTAYSTHMKLPNLQLSEQYLLASDRKNHLCKQLIIDRPAILSFTHSASSHL